MSIVDKINEKTGKFANNIAEAVADLLGKEVKATTIVENIGEGNNIQEAIDNLSGKQSANIMEAIDNYNGDDTQKSMTIEEALENTGIGPAPSEILLMTGGAETKLNISSTPITALTPVYNKDYSGAIELRFTNLEVSKSEDEWEPLPSSGYTSEDVAYEDGVLFADQVVIDSEIYLTATGGDYRLYDELEQGYGLKWDSLEVWGIVSNTANSMPDFNSMTKAELQAWADENNISGADQNSQTKAEMIETIEAALNA